LKVKNIIWNQIIYFITPIGVIIEYPSNKYIEERQRKDLDIIDPIFRYYIIPHEIQFHADALQNRLEFFLKCKGTINSIKFTVPPAAIDVSIHLH